MFVSVTCIHVCVCVCVGTTSQISPDGPHPDPTNKKQTTTKAHYDNPHPSPTHL